MYLPRVREVYYGWVMVLTLALTETHLLGYSVLCVYGVPNADAGGAGWSRAAMTGAFSLALLLSGLAGIPVGRWLDRYGPRVLMTLGSCAATLLVLAWGGVQHLTMFYLIWAGIGVIMAAVLYEPAFFVVATWFVRQRGRALTVLTLLAGLASVIYIPGRDWNASDTNLWRAPHRA